MTTARLLIDDPAPGSWNMAVDEALLESAAHRDTLTLRIYGWSEPTLSLGYFQRHEERAQHAASRGCPMVRRTTGGGAILHHHDVTYSVTAPISSRLDRELENWYRSMHDAWIAVLHQWGIRAERCDRTDSEREHRFLCFERRAAGDLLLGSMKIGGSAQRRHARAALQHGSLLLKRSEAAPELPGIGDLVGGGDLLGRDWFADWLDVLARLWRVTWNPSELSGAERDRAAEAVRCKFEHPHWTLRR